MRTLTFEQITDSRFDKDIENLLADRVSYLMDLFKNMDGVYVFHGSLEKVTFSNNEQYRCRFWIRKDGRKTTWNDIYKTVNSIKAVPYTFIDMD